MIHQLPKWVELGSFFLANLAGIVNAIGLLGFEHQSVSHLSGVATRLGVDMLDFNQYTLHLILILLSFLSGSAISGYLIEGAALKLGRHYSFALLLEGLLLFASMVVLLDEQTAGHYLASAACGLQNALVTSYSGAVIRTTHVTGIFTDLGLILGARLKGKKVDRRKVILLSTIIGGFISGGTTGAFLFNKIGYQALLVPAFMALGMALLYHFFGHEDE